MVYNRFRLNCLIRVILLGLTIFGFFFILFRTSLYAALFIVGVFIIYQTYALIHFVEKTNRDLTRFFTSIRYSDFSQTFKDVGLGPSFDGLRKAFTEVMNVFRKTRTEKEEHYRYLQTVVQHIGIGLIAYQSNGDVELINTSAKRLLGIPALKEMIKDSYQIPTAKQKIDSESLTDIRDAAQTIQKRSQGLLHFVDAYRNLTLIQKPSFQLFPVKELFARVEKLMQTNIKEKAIRLQINVDPKTLELTADPELIEQVLINLLLNALQSVEGQKKAKIDLIAHLDGRGRILIRIKDNGPGIEDENLEKIFIPFFSTKDMGSGIGLSLSRQIMRLHHGAIAVHSEPKKQTIFTLRF